MGKTLDGLIFRWFTEDVDSIKRRLDALEAQGERAMAKVVDLIAAVQAGTDATLAAIGQETSELAAIIGAQTAALVALQEQIAAGDFVTAEQKIGRAHV